MQKSLKSLHKSSTQRRASVLASCGKTLVTLRESHTGKDILGILRTLGKPLIGWLFVKLIFLGVCSVCDRIDGEHIAEWVKTTVNIVENIVLFVFFLMFSLRDLIKFLKDLWADVIKK